MLALATCAVAAMASGAAASVDGPTVAFGDDCTSVTLSGQGLGAYDLFYVGDVEPARGAIGTGHDSWQAAPGRVFAAVEFKNGSLEQSLFTCSDPPVGDSGAVSGTGGGSGTG
ncbi:MAG: hypothetical protein KY457_11555, partial [Actinobacteria bacterium]|nr:hypothetical protein [Actinomycetota bacterium]